ncbi:MAG: hypothetical protein Q8K93_00870 [Reyranella sp.]|nr:hypothetical protein [Reyranella sp.]
MTAALITIEYEDPIDGTVQVRFEQESEALGFEEMLDAEGAWHRRLPLPAEPKSPLLQAVEKARGGPADTPRRGFA